MNAMITDGVQVAVETFYQRDYSDPMTHSYMFAYRVTILNHNSYPVKIVSRHWDIWDSNGDFREVDGQGVVGLTPVIDAAGEYQYVSGCNLHTEIGKMSGWYTVENLRGKEQFKVLIPPFTMETPGIQN